MGHDSRKFLIVVTRSMRVGTYDRIVTPHRAEVVVGMEMAFDYKADFDQGEEVTILVWEAGKTRQLNKKEWAEYDAIHEKRRQKEARP